MANKNRIINTCQNITRLSGQVISWLSLAIVIIVFVIVVLRYLFNYGSIALQESVNYMYALLFLVGIAYTLQYDEHVRVDIFYTQFSSKTKAWVNLFGFLLLMFPMVIFIFWVSFDYVSSAWKIKESSGEAGGLDYVYLLKSGILLMASLLFIEGIAQSLLAIEKIREKS